MHQVISFIKHALTAKRNGHGVHSPFAYRLCEEVFYSPDSFYDLEALKKVRAALLKNEGMLTIEDFGAGSKTFKDPTRKINDIAARGISSEKQSELLYKLINFLGCNNCLELGTSIGLNTLYMAKANVSGKVTSIEGSRSLFDFSKTLAEKNSCSNIQFIHSKFDEGLPEVLNNMQALDLLYVDGNHAYLPTLSYFHAALAKKHNNSVFIFDDIYWSKDMTKAWQEIIRHPQVRLSIDCFYFGIVFFREEVKEKMDLKFYVSLG